MTPREHVRRACRELGESALVQRCAAQLAGGPLDLELAEYLAGPQRARWLESPAHGYWPRVWAARALLYAWHPGAEPAVVGALDDEAWRVREMAAKVCALREIGAAGDALDRCAADDIGRVRAAAARALGAVGESEHAPTLRRLLSDMDFRVRAPAERALRLLAERLDRPL